MTVTVGCVVSTNYAAFVPGWLDSVRALERAPDEIVAVTNIADWPDDVRVVEPPSAEFDWPKWHSTLFGTCTTDWCSWVNADDRYRPHALNGWPDWDVDVAVMGNQIWPGHDDAQSIAAAGYNHVTCGSPIRLAAYREAFPDGVPDLMPYSDWAIWVGLAKSGATFRCTRRIDFDYRVHAATPTEIEPTRSRIQAWAASL